MPDSIAASGAEAVSNTPETLLTTPFFPIFLTLSWIASLSSILFSVADNLELGESFLDSEPLDKSITSPVFLLTIFILTPQNLLRKSEKQVLDNLPRPA